MGDNSNNAAATTPNSNSSNANNNNNKIKIKFVACDEYSERLVASADCKSILYLTLQVP
jgi:hypothetical protein